MKSCSKLIALFVCFALHGGSYLLAQKHDDSKAQSTTASWVKTEIPLKIYRYESGHFGRASANGFWQATSAEEGKQLVFPIVVQITCYREEGICREVDASVQFGILKSEMTEYKISSWTEAGILADDEDEGLCGIGHRLTLDFKSNSVLVTDYPKKITDKAFCKGLQDANSYALHGGQIMLYPPAPLNPASKSTQK